MGTRPDQSRPERRHRVTLHARLSSTAILRMFDTAMVVRRPTEECRGVDERPLSVSAAPPWPLQVGSDGALLGCDGRRVVGDHP